MLLLLIPIAWLAVVIVIVAACQAAAQGETNWSPGEEKPPQPIREGLVVWEEATALATRTRRRALHRHVRARGRRQESRTGRATARGLR
ncbi:MAG TPA: hypothetical protein VNZ05_05780 [Solirubrobacteraceae bacterium]|jgi:hypothetical protein|nr:hypothetical protein [Solirubrobacteraceae bacterium]